MSVVSSRDNSLIFAGSGSRYVWEPKTLPVELSKFRRQVVREVREITRIVFNPGQDTTVRFFPVMATRLQKFP